MRTNEERQVIAIDGPSASGKSTVARGVASQLGWLYVDSGALYRSLTWKAVRAGIDAGDEAGLAEMADRTAVDFLVRNGAVVFKVDGEEPSDSLRGPEVNRNVSRVAAIPAVRKMAVRNLRQLSRLGSLVMEGRDIGTGVFPEAEHKFYLDAAPEERARRRHAEIRGGDAPVSVASVNADLRRRDEVDRSRGMDPLRVADAAVVIDSTGLGATDVIRLILDKVSMPSGGALSGKDTR